MRAIRDDARPDDPERIGFLRRHWRRGEFTLEELQRITGFTAQEIAIIAEKEKFPPRVHARPVTSHNRSHWCGKTCPGLPRCPERGVMVSRLFGAVEREIARFERQASDDLPATDFRVLGALTSTLDKLFALDRDFLRTPATDGPVQDHAHAQDPYDPDIAKRIRDAIAQALDGIGDSPDALPPQARDFLHFDWAFHARPDQWPPHGDWRHWLMIGGRGAGKTRAGAEWVRACVHGRLPFTAKPTGPVALIGETLADVRDVMIEGPSGLIALSPPAERPRWQGSRRRLDWPNGMQAFAFSSEDPESLRGPQFALCWADELAKWTYAQATWDNLVFGLRLGERPRVMVTTTPRPVPLLKALLADPASVTTHATTAANAAHLAPSFLTELEARYGGTRLGRQELLGEMIEDFEGALWTRDLFEAHRLRVAPVLTRIVIAIDPPASHREGADACGIIAAGLSAEGVVYVLADRSASGLKPHEWAARAIALYAETEADALVAEVNQGGDMVAAIIHDIDPAVPVLPVRATRGKHIRAEPVAALYAAGRVRHVGAFPALEDEACAFGADGRSAGHSPDRVDALVWAVTALVQGAGKSMPRVRGV